MAPRILPATSDDAPEATKPLLAQLQTALGMVPNIYATVGRSPGALSSVLTWDAALGKGALSRREIEMLSLHVSELNGCGYCLSAHSALGKRAGLSDAEVEDARRGIAKSPRENALLALARRVLRTGGSRAAGELTRAREVGVTDAEIVDTFAVVALRTFTNAVGLVARVEIDFPKAPNLPAD
jgi:uncharacterized peroxidase-related enzyme